MEVFAPWCTIADESGNFFLLPVSIFTALIVIHGVNWDIEEVEALSN